VVRRWGWEGGWERVGFEGMAVIFGYLGWRDDCKYSEDGMEMRR
jgi:hypothetical protein